MQTIQWSDLKGKSIALVGPAGYLEGQLMGPLIDSFDLVARVGDAFPKQKDFPHYGSRTDIVFDNFCGWHDYAPRIIDKVDYLLTLHGKHLRCLLDDLGFANLRRHCEGKSNWSNFTHSIIPIESIKKIESEIGHKPTKGAAAIFDLLEAPIKELFVTGIAFYQKELIQKPYADFYWKEGNDLDFGPASWDGHHNFDAEFQAFIRLKEKDLRIMVDCFIDEMMQNPD